MKKQKDLSPNKGTMSTFPARDPRSEELRQDPRQKPKPPAGQAPAQVRQPRRQLVEDAEGFQSIVHRRRSPRRDAMVEDRDFESPVPAKRAAKLKKVKAAEASAPKPVPQVQGDSASEAEQAEAPQGALEGPIIEPVEDVSSGSAGEDISGDVSGVVEGELEFSSSASDADISPPSCVRTKKSKFHSPLPKKRTSSGAKRVKSRVLPQFPVAGAQDDSATTPRQPPLPPAGRMRMLPHIPGQGGPSNPSSPELVNPSSPLESRRSGSFLQEDCKVVGAQALEQVLYLRETSVQGDCLFDSILQSLLMRQQCCDWSFLRPIPRTVHDLRMQLCDFAVLNSQIPLPYGDHPTPDQVVGGDYISGAIPLRDPIWEHFNNKDQPNSSPGRYLASFQDYIDAMRSPSANGDELMVALASIFFGVRIVIFGSRKRSVGHHFWDMQADYHPPNVSRARHLLLVHLPGHYQWAHPHRDDCFHHEHASPLSLPLGSTTLSIGKITGRIRLMATEWFESWTRLPRAFTREAFAAAGRRWDAAGGGILPGDRPDVVVDGPKAREFVHLWPLPETQDTKSEAQREPVFSRELLAHYKDDAEEIVQNLAERGLCIALGDAAAALHFTRNLTTGHTDMARAYDCLPGGANNPLDVDSPPQPPMKGKRAALNEEKRKGSALKDGVSEKANVESGRTCTCTHQDHCPCPSSNQPPDPRDEMERNRELGRQLADELQLKQTAVETIVTLTGCDENLARATLERHLLHTTSMQQAISACCCDLHPAARSYTFTESALGEGVRPLTVRETAKHLAHQQNEQARDRHQHQSEALQTPVSELHPVNLNQRFLHDAAQHLKNHELSNLPANKRLAVANNRAVHEQWDAAIDHATWQRDFNTPKELTNQPNKPPPYSHSSPAVRMAAAREAQLQGQQNGMQAPMVVVMGGGAAKLPTWQLGEESQQRGFCWSTKQYIQQAWRQYMMAEGMHAPRTFKSLISQQLVPTICAETNIPLSDWEHLSDRVLLEKIEERLKPKNATDIINRLRELTISRDTTKGTLSQRYRLFAETFLQRLAEAKECSCEVSEAAVKQTFTRAARQEPVLDSWLSEEKWVDVWTAHRRIVNKLRDYDAWAVYDSMQKTVVQHAHVPQSAPHPPPPAKQTDHSTGQKRPWDGGKQHQSFINTLAKLVQATANNTGGAPHHTPEKKVSFDPQQQRDDYRHPGLDARGLNWHICTEHIKCRDEPCTGLFCQICGFHGHTARTCSKRLKQVPGINLHGYFQESKPNCPPVRYEGVEGRYGNTGGPSRPQYTFNGPRTNTMHGQPGSSSNLQQPDQFPHFLNSQQRQEYVSSHQATANTATRTASSSSHPERKERVSKSNQTNGESGGGSAYDVEKSSQRDGQ
jgi:hypothetical protein